MISIQDRDLSRRRMFMTGASAYVPRRRWQAAVQKPRHRLD